MKDHNDRKFLRLQIVTVSLVVIVIGTIIVSNISKSINFALWESAIRAHMDNKPDEAIKLYEKIIKRKKNYMSAYSGLILAYNEKEQYTTSLNYCDMAIKVNKNYPDAYFYKGYISYITGDLKKAEYYLLKVINFNGEDYLKKKKKEYKTSNFIDINHNFIMDIAYYYLGLIYYMDNQIAESRKYFKYFVKLEKDSDSLEKDLSIKLLEKLKYF